MEYLELWVLRGPLNEIIGTYRTYRGLKIALGKREKELFSKVETIRKENPNHTRVYSFKLESV